MESLLIIFDLSQAEKSMAKKPAPFRMKNGMGDADLTKRRSQGTGPETNSFWLERPKKTAVQVSLFLGTGYLIYYIKKVPQPQGKGVDFLL